MILTIHQPNYFPYPGFFHKLSLAEVFVIMDDVQYQYDYTNRNKIISQDGNWQRITVPTKREHKFFPIMLVEINNDLPWKEITWNSIYNSYKDAKFFHLYKDYFEKLYKKDWKLLFDLNFETIKKVIEWLGIKIELIRESELSISGKLTERLINVCKTLGVDTYVSGKGGKNYLDEKLFEKNNVKIQYQNYVTPVYPQQFSKSFIPDLSVIDLLANVGPDSLKVIQGNQIG